MMRSVTVMLAAVFALGAGGCAVHEAFVSREAAAPIVRECEDWYRNLDARIDAAGVRDAQARRIAGYPYLRVDRWSGVMRPEPGVEPERYSAWIARLMALDFEARGFEIRNLASVERARPEVGSTSEHPAVGRAGRCAQLMLQHDRGQAGFHTALARGALVPDDYSDFRRALGFYAVTRLVFSKGVRAWEDEAREVFATSYRASAPVRHYAPAAATPSAPPVVPADLPLDALGMPRTDSAQLAQLFRDHAPRFAVETQSDDDRFGALTWRAGSDVPAVDPGHPVVYQHLDWMRYGKTTLAQLAYTIWFPRRPSDGPFDLLAGELDGLTWRVTVDPQGRPLLADAIHPCGCFHMFFPTRQATPRPAPDPDEEWAFIPAALPEVERGAQLTVVLSARAHQIVGVSAGSRDARIADPPLHYDLLPYDVLRALPLPGGGSRSAFGPDGLIAGTERAERFVFWPMGIRSPGAMRQRGRQPTAFVGRRHFDQPDLIEQRFALDLGARSR